MSRSWEPPEDDNSPAVSDYILAAIAMVVLIAVMCIVGGIEH